MPAAVMSPGRRWLFGGSEERLLPVAFWQVSGCCCQQCCGEGFPFVSDVVVYFGALEGQFLSSPGSVCGGSLALVHAHPSSSDPHLPPGPAQLSLSQNKPV